MNVKSIAGRLGERRTRFALRSVFAHPLADYWSVSGFVALTRLAAGYQDKPAVDELAMSIADNLTVTGAWIGKGELNFSETNGEELHALAPNRIEAGFRYSLSYSVSDLKILEDHGL
jgi:hypothetical protein